MMRIRVRLHARSLVHRRFKRPNQSFEISARPYVWTPVTARQRASAGTPPSDEKNNSVPYRCEQIAVTAQDSFLGGSMETLDHFPVANRYRGTTNYIRVLAELVRAA